MIEIVWVCADQRDPLAQRGFVCAKLYSLGKQYGGLIRYTGTDRPSLRQVVQAKTLVKGAMKKRRFAARQGKKSPFVRRMEERREQEAWG